MTDQYMTDDGGFDRDSDYITTRITADGRDGYPVEPGRYRLVVARACPWANRAIIVRRLLGLEPVLSMGICGPTHDERSWTFDLDPGGRDPVLGIERLQEAFLSRDPDYPRGITVPAMVDIPTGSRRDERLRADDPGPLDRVDGVPPRRRAGPVPGVAARRDRRGGRARLSRRQQRRVQVRVRRLPGRVRQGVPHGCSTGSTGCRIACHSSATSSATRSPRPTSGCSRPWPGSIAVYHGHFKCNRQKLTELPVLWAYARDLFQTPGFGDTIDFVHIKQHYYLVHKDINPTRHRPGRPGPVRLADAARPRATRRPPVRRRHPARSAGPGRGGADRPFRLGRSRTRRGPPPCRRCRAPRRTRVRTSRAPRPAAASGCRRLPRRPASGRRP